MNSPEISISELMMRAFVTSLIILILDGFKCIHGKGLAVIGGKGNREGKLDLVISSE